jgi:anti-sigma factor RsiW
MAKVTSEQLIDLAEGRLSAQAAEALRQRIVGDPILTSDLAAFEKLIKLMRSDTSVDAPEHVIARAVRLMRKPRPAPGPGLLRRLVALLHSDSLGQPLAYGLRSGAESARTLSYEAEDWDIALQLTPWAGRWQLRGQVLGPEIASDVTLEAGAAPLVAPVNELGEFALPPVEPGCYRLLVRAETREILVESLELEPLTT